MGVSLPAVIVRASSATRGVRTMTRTSLQASTDSLTGLGNRDALMRGLANAINEARPHCGPAILHIGVVSLKCAI